MEQQQQGRAEAVGLHLVKDGAHSSSKEGYRGANSSSKLSCTPAYAHAGSPKGKVLS
jgi:hypothetical protein